MVPATNLEADCLPCTPASCNLSLAPCALPDARSPCF